MANGWEAIDREAVLKDAIVVHLVIALLLEVVFQLGPLPHLANIKGRSMYI